MRKKILQIISADGWQVVYRLDGGRKAANRILCFALVEETDGRGDVSRYVVPMDASDDGMIDDVTDSRNFINFLRVERVEPSERWHEIGE